MATAKREPKKTNIKGKTMPVPKSTKNMPPGLAKYWANKKKAAK